MANYERTLDEAMGLTPAEITELREKAERLGVLEPETRDCDSHGCDRHAVVALRFENQAGHVHDCAQHAAELREWCAVAESHPLPCPWPHNGAVWVDRPKSLE